MRETFLMFLFFESKRRVNKMFWIGVLIGLIIGANVSLILYACIVAGGKADEHIDESTIK